VPFHGARGAFLPDFVGWNMRAVGWNMRAVGWTLRVQCPLQTDSPAPATQFSRQDSPKCSFDTEPWPEPAHRALGPDSQTGMCTTVFQRPACR